MTIATLLRAKELKNTLDQLKTLDPVKDFDLLASICETENLEIRLGNEMLRVREAIKQQIQHLFDQL